MSQAESRPPHQSSVWPQPIAEDPGTQGEKDSRRWPLFSIHSIPVCAPAAWGPHLCPPMHRVHCGPRPVTPCFSLHVEVPTSPFFVSLSLPSQSYPPPALTSHTRSKPRDGRVCVLSWATAGPSRKTCLLHSPLSSHSYPILGGHGQRTESRGGGQQRSPPLYLFADNSRQGTHDGRPWPQRGEVATALNGVGSFEHYMGLCRSSIS